MVAGFEQPTEGEVFLEGKPVAKVRPHKRHVNTVFQSYALSSTSTSRATSRSG